MSWPSLPRLKNPPPRPQLKSIVHIRALFRNNDPPSPAFQHVSTFSRRAPSLNGEDETAEGPYKRYCERELATIRQRFAFARQLGGLGLVAAGQRQASVDVRLMWLLHPLLKAGSASSPLKALFFAVGPWSVRRDRRLLHRPRRQGQALDATMEIEATVRERSALRAPLEGREMSVCSTKTKRTLRPPAPRNKRHLFE
jgi:hypothetical protein